MNAEKLWRWLNDRVDKARGSLEFGYDEGGRVGLWRGDEKLGVGPDATGAALDAVRREGVPIKATR